MVLRTLMCLMVRENFAAIIVGLWWASKLTVQAKGLAKKKIKHIMPNFVFKPWPGGPTDHGNH
jgi:hypothetical protein